jgi:transcriptional regulator with XRE-family HTH domain
MASSNESAYLLEGDRRVRFHLQRLRVAAGLTLSQASESTGYLAQSLSRVELGEQRLYPSMVASFAALYGVPIDALFAPIADAAPAHERPRQSLVFMQATHAIEDGELLEGLLSMTRAIVAAQRRAHTQREARKDP